METLQFLTSIHEDFPGKAREQQADTHLRVIRGDEIRASCSLWWRSTPDYLGQPLGAIGHYEACDDAAASLLLEAALSTLREAGLTHAVGPLDGNTWRRYRFVTERGEEPPFFLEPGNPAAYPAQWQSAGFTPLAEYFSALCTDLSIVDPRLERVAQRLTGVTIRPLDFTQFREELEAIYAVSTASFVENFLYTPLSQRDFLAQYLPLRDLIDPRLILLAEYDSEPVGYVFALPDLARPHNQPPEPPETVILKTVACLPGRRWAGLGSLLVGRLHAAAHQMGSRRIIHALMHESNNSRNLSGIYAQTMRRYTLFSRDLSQ